MGDSSARGESLTRPVRRVVFMVLAVGVALVAGFISWAAGPAAASPAQEPTQEQVAAMLLRARAEQEPRIFAIEPRFPQPIERMLLNHVESALRDAIQDELSKDPSVGPDELERRARLNPKYAESDVIVDPVAYVYADPENIAFIQRWPEIVNRSEPASASAAAPAQAPASAAESTASATFGGAQYSPPPGERFDVGHCMVAMSLYALQHGDGPDAAFLFCAQLAGEWEARHQSPGSNTGTSGTSSAPQASSASQLTTGTSPATAVGSNASTSTGSTQTGSTPAQVPLSNGSSGGTPTAVQDWMKQLRSAGMEHSESSWKNMERCLTEQYNGGKRTFDTAALACLGVE